MIYLSAITLLSFEWCCCAAVNSSSRGSENEGETDHLLFDVWFSFSHNRSANGQMYFSRMTFLRQPQPLILTGKMRCATQRAHIVDVQVHCSKSQSIRSTWLENSACGGCWLPGESVKRRSIPQQLPWRETTPTSNEMSLDPLLTTRHNEHLLLCCSQNSHSSTAAAVMVVSWQEVTVEVGWLNSSLQNNSSFQLWHLHSADALSHCQSFRRLTQPPGWEKHDRSGPCQQKHNHATVLLAFCSVHWTLYWLKRVWKLLA